MLARLVQHFSQVSLRNDRMAEPDLLGRAYEYLIEQFADDAGKKGGEFYTPRMVVKLIVELLATTERMRICDPTVGSGGMLIECAHYIERKGGNPRNLTLHGQEKNLGTWAICKMNMLLHGLPDARIEKGDTIRDPKLVDEGELLLYDGAIANPPFSLDKWGRDVAENDGYGRFRFGVPPKTKGDLAFVQHMVAVLNGTGRLGVPMPRVIVSDQQKRWGSCDQNGTIRLNWRIIQAPMRLVDYVVVHELVHQRHRGHSRDYWQEVGRIMPDYERRREDLRRCGVGLAW